MPPLTSWNIRVRSINSLETFVWNFIFEMRINLDKWKTCYCFFCSKNKNCKKQKFSLFYVWTGSGHFFLIFFRNVQITKKKLFFCYTITCFYDALCYLDRSVQSNWSKKICTFPAKLFDIRNNVKVILVEWKIGKYIWIKNL